MAWPKGKPRNSAKKQAGNAQKKSKSAKRSKPNKLTLLLSQKKKLEAELRRVNSKIRSEIRRIEKSL